jgi:hypothetical protein
MTASKGEWGSEKYTFSFKKALNFISYIDSVKITATSTYTACYEYLIVKLALITVISLCYDCLFTVTISYHDSEIYLYCVLINALG